MTREHDDLLIQRYLQSDLEPAEKAQLETRLETDGDLKSLLEHYRSMAKDLEDLSRFEMPADLWRRRIKPALAERLGQNESWFEKISNLFAGFRTLALKPAVVAAAFFVIIVGVTFMIQQQFMSEPLQQPYERALDEIESIRKNYVKQLDVLIAEMETRKSRMNQDLLAVYDETLKKVDDAIADAERFYALYSDEQDAIEIVLAAYDKKANFLTQFIDLTNSEL